MNFKILSIFFVFFSITSFSQKHSEVKVEEFEESIKLICQEQWTEKMGFTCSDINTQDGTVELTLSKTGWRSWWSSNQTDQYSVYKLSFRRAEIKEGFKLDQLQRVITLNDKKFPKKRIEIQLINYTEVLSEPIQKVKLSVNFLNSAGYEIFTSETVHFFL